MAANRTTQKRASAASASSTNARSALIWGSLALCSILAVCALVALRMGGPGSTIATARISTTPPPAQPVIQKSSSQSEFEIARLNDAIRTLAAERDRLSARVETLEQSVGDITASINNAKKPEVKPEAKIEAKAELQPEAPAAPERAAVAEPREPAPLNTAISEKPKIAETDKPASEPSPKVATAPEPPARATQQVESPPVSAAPVQPREQAVRAPAQHQPAGATQNPFFTAMTSFMNRDEKPAPRASTTRAHRIEYPGQNPKAVASKQQPRKKAEPAPLPPPRPAANNGPATQVAQIMPNQAVKTAPQGDITGATQTQFGIDLGGETSLDSLRARWVALQNKHGNTLAGLRPLVRVREGSRPGTVELHLVAGPVANAATAARVCANLQSTGIACRASEYDGQRLPSR